MEPSPKDDPEFRQAVVDSLERLVPGVDVGRLIYDIEQVDSTSVFNGAAHHRIVIRLRGADRDMIVGQFPPFSKDQLRGFHENYVFGYVHGWYAARHGRNLREDYELVLDVADSGSDPAFPPPVRYLQLDEVVDLGLVVPGAPLHHVMKTNGLSYALVSGLRISGPSAAMIEMVRRIVQRDGVEAVLDLYAGTGSLSKVALSSGAKTATVIETNLDSRVLEGTLGPMRKQCEVLEGEVEHLLPAGKFDLAILDPFYDFALTTIRLVLPQLKDHCKNVIVNLGHPEPRSWVDMLTAELRRLGLEAELHRAYDEVVAVGSFA